jgi:hypothetical protein
METLNLYRLILRSAKRFPSIKRHKIVEEIRQGFRENRTLPEGNERESALSVAIKGLQQLNMYSNLPKNAREWSVDLESQPMPKGMNEGNKDN